MAKELVYWDSNPNPGRTEAFTLAGNTFARANGLSFKYVPKGIAGYPESVLGAWEAGTGPDIIDVWPLWIPRLKASGKLLDLGPPVESWERRADYDRSHEALSRSVDDRFWFLACDLFVQGTHFRRDLVETAGLEDPAALAESGKWTIERFREYARLLNDPSKGIAGAALRGGQGGELTALNLMVSATGGHLFDDSGRCLLDQPQAVSSLDHYTAIGALDRSCQPTAPTDGYREFAWHFYEGRAALMLHNDDGVKAALGRYLGRDRYGNAPLPSPDGHPRLGLAGFGVGVHAGSPLADEAARYACFFVENYSLNIGKGNRALGNSRMNHVSCGPMHPWPKERDPFVEPFRRILESADRFFTLPYACPGYADAVATTLQPGLARLLGGGAEAASIAAEWARAMEACRS